MPRSILYFLLVVFSVFNVYLLFRVNQKPVPAGSAIQTKDDNNTAYTELLRGRIILQSKYPPVLVSAGAVITDTTGKEFNLASAIKEDETIVFFFTHKHCYSCIDGAMPKLEKLSNEVGRMRIMLLGQLKEKRDILSFKSRYNTNLPVYFINDSALRSDAIQLNHPFIFLLKRDLNASAPFFIESSLPEVTDDFINEMKKRFIRHR